MALWTPASLGSTLTLWLKGDDLTGSNGSSVSTWTDASGNSRNATASGNSPTLVTSGLNGMNTVAFGGASATQGLDLPSSVISGKSASVGGAGFAVFALHADPPSGPFDTGPVFGNFGNDSVAVNNHNPYVDGNYYDFYCSNSRRSVSGVPSSTGFRIFGLRSKTNDWRLDMDGTNYSTDTTNTFSNSNTDLHIGRTTGGYYLYGQIAEVVDCSDFLSTADKERVEGYLAWKWGLQGNLPSGHTYKSAAPTCRQWLPSDLSSGKLTLWLKGDDLTGSNGSEISTWADASGNGNNATGQTTATNKPTLVTSGLNGLNVVADNNRGYFSLPTGMLTGRTQGACFALYKKNASPSEFGPVIGDFGGDAPTGDHMPWSDSHFYSDYGAASRHITTTGEVSPTGSWLLLGIRAKSADWRIDMNAVNNLTDSTNTFATSSAPLLLYTAVANHHLDGQVAEIVDCSDFLTTSEKEQVEGYLAWKWGKQSLLPTAHTYKHAAPTFNTTSAPVTRIQPRNCFVF